MELNSDDSWEPEPCNPSDLCGEEGFKDLDIDASDSLCDGQHASTDIAGFRYGCRLAHKRARMPDGYGGTALIPMPGRVDTMTINSGSVLTCANFPESKKAKQGMHGNQVGTANHIFHSNASKLLPSCRIQRRLERPKPKNGAPRAGVRWCWPFLLFKLQRPACI